MSAPLPEAIEPDLVKSCCAALYASDWVRLLLGVSFHPGGTRLTDRLADLLELGPETRVLDVAAGVGTSAIHLAAQRGCRVVGTDISSANVAEASRRARLAGVADLVEFSESDAESLDQPAGSFDAVICECAFCTFPDKLAAARGFARVLRPGGRVGIADLTRRGGLPSELETLVAWVACVGDAQPIADYCARLEEAGLGVEHTEAHDDALLAMVSGVREKLLGTRLLVELGRLTLAGIDLDTVQATARAAAGAVRDGLLGYAIVCARKPPASEHR